MAVARKKERIMVKIADAFEQLAGSLLNAPAPRVEVARFAQACRLVSPLIRQLGIGFKFADMEFSAKVNDLIEAAKSVHTLEDLVNRDLEQNTAMISSSNSRNLIRVKRSIDMLRIMFEQILARRGNSIMVPVSISYEQVFSPFHGWAIRTAVSAAMYTLPTKSQLLKKLNEDEASAKVQMQKFVTASAPVIQYIDNLFHSRESGEEVLRLI